MLTFVQEYVLMYAPKTLATIFSMCSLHEDDTEIFNTNYNLDVPSI
jgi:hypothetical protein